MVVGKGKRKASASKSKAKNSAIVLAEPEPLKTSIDGEEENHETSTKYVMSMEVEDVDEMVNEFIVDDGHQQSEQNGDEVNADDLDQLDGAENSPSNEEAEEETEAVNDIGDATNIDDVEDNEENTNEEELEEDEEPMNHAEEEVDAVSDIGNATNIGDVEDNEENTNEEELEEDEEPMNHALDNEDVNPEEERKSSEVPLEGETTNDEGLVAAGLGTMDEKMTGNLENEGESSKKADEPMGTLANNGEVECTRDDSTAANDVKAIPEKVNRPKRKVLKKKVVVKKRVRMDDVASGNEVKPQSSNGNDASGEANKADTDQHVKNEDKDEVKLQSSSGNDASGEANKEDTDQHVKNEEKAEVKPSVKLSRKLRRLRKKKLPEDDAGKAGGTDEQKPKSANDEAGVTENKESDKQVNNEEATKSKDGGNRSKKKRKKKVANEDLNKAGQSQNSKSSKKVDSMGMVFMCTSATKKDCYRYKVLGLPAGKKDLVSKIYKGMRLFLFDLDLRMMYGIYKAAGPGGYNVEPRAFKSQFPSQVRFTVMEDCLPLAEEKFKKVIKDNYYTKNKFNCQLTSEQVKNLCKLFHETTKRSESKQASKSQVGPPPSSSSSRRDKKRKMVDESRKTTRPVPSSSDRDRSKRRAPRDHQSRLEPVILGDRYHHHECPVVYQREAAYLAPVAPSPIYHHPLPAPSPPRSSSYSYGRASGVDIYRRDPPVEYHREVRDRVESYADDPYVSYVQPRAYREPLYETSYETGVRRENYDYSSDRGRVEYSDQRQVEYYRPLEYRAPLPLYRRY